MTSLHPIYEMLAKEAAYVYDDPNYSQLVHQILTTSGYDIDQVFDDPNTGFQAIGLTSTTPDKPPVLVFRGTNEPLDEVTNTDPRGMGLSQFTANREAIVAWLTKVEQQTQQKPDITGHSLGGALTQVAATELTDLVGEIVTFSSPGTSNAIASQFLQNGGADKTVTHYIVNGDVISLAGETFIAGKAILQSFNDPAINPIFALDKHGQIGRLLSSPPPGYTQKEISIQQLSAPDFTFEDSDYEELLASIQAIDPDTAQFLTSRNAVETLRLTPGFSFLELIFGTRDALAPDKDNFLVGDRQNNTADGAEGNDTIIGKEGNDWLEAGSGNDTVNGGSGEDSLFGASGKDLLTGGCDQDLLVGGDGQDTLIGVEPMSSRSGFQEVDLLTGGDGADVFVLGDEQQAFYDDGKRGTSGQGDYGLITDFQDGDTIQLHGTADDYVLKPTPQCLPLGTAIYLDGAGKDELIGILQGVTDLNLDSNFFSFL